MKNNRDVLVRELEAFETRRAQLEREHFGEWVLFHGPNLIGIFETLDSTADEAVRRFGRGPYLIRRVGAPLLTARAPVMRDSDPN
jgi:hypothetical protein